MLWIKSLFIILVALAVMLSGFEFFVVNSEPVKVNYIIGATQLPLSVVVLWAFTAGALLAVLIGFFVVMPLRWRVARLKSTVDNQKQEIGILQKKSGQDVR
jgi:uncharacterized integral membrane protein